MVVLVGAVLPAGRRRGHGRRPIGRPARRWAAGAVVARGRSLAVAGRRRAAARRPRRRRRAGPAALLSTEWPSPRHRRPRRGRRPRRRRRHGARRVARPARPGATWPRCSPSSRRTSRSSRRARRPVRHARRRGPGSSAAVCCAAVGSDGSPLPATAPPLPPSADSSPSSALPWWSASPPHWRCRSTGACRSPGRRAAAGPCRRRSTRSRPSRPCGRLDPPIDLFRVELDGDRRRRGDGAPPRSTRLRRRAVARDVDAATDRAPPRARTASGRCRSGVEFVTDDLDLVPLPGDAVTVDAAVETDAARDVVRTVDRPAPGAAWSRHRRPDRRHRPTRRRRRRDAPRRRRRRRRFTSAARELVAAGDRPRTAPPARARRCATSSPSIRTRPGAGVQQALIERFVRDTRRGSAEQFVAAFVAAGPVARRRRPDRQRVRRSRGRADADGDAALGHRRRSGPRSASRASGGCRSTRCRPTRRRTWRRAAPPPAQRLTPIAPQPPVVPPAEPADDPPDDDEADDAASAGVWARCPALGGARRRRRRDRRHPARRGRRRRSCWLKRRRRRRLLDAPPTPHGRARGAWAVANDVMTDAGLDGRRDVDRPRTAAEGGQWRRAPASQLSGLAALSAAATFGPGFDADPTPYAVACVAVVDAAVLAGRTRRRRAALPPQHALAARRRTRSPIAAADWIERTMRGVGIRLALTDASDAGGGTAPVTWSAADRARTC